MLFLTGYILHSLILGVPRHLPIPNATHKDLHSNTSSPTTTPRKHGRTMFAQVTWSKWERLLPTRVHCKYGNLTGLHHDYHSDLCVPLITPPLFWSNHICFHLTPAIDVQKQCFPTDGVIWGWQSLGICIHVLGPICRWRPLPFVGTYCWKLLWVLKWEIL